MNFEDIKIRKFDLPPESRELMELMQLNYINRLQSKPVELEEFREEAAKAIEQFRHEYLLLSSYTTHLEIALKNIKDVFQFADLTERQRLILIQGLVSQTPIKRN